MKHKDNHKIRKISIVKPFDSKRFVITPAVIAILLLISWIYSSENYIDPASSDYFDCSQQFTNCVWLVWPYIAGMAIALLAGHYAVSSVVKTMWDYLRAIHPQEEKGILVTYEGQGGVVGIVERSLYYGSLLVQQPLFVGVWLTLKTVSQSPRWSKDTGPVQGRGIFQPFLAGTGLSLLFAVGGFLITQNLLRGLGGFFASFLLSAGLLVIWLSCLTISFFAIKPFLENSATK